MKARLPVAEPNIIDRVVGYFSPVRGMERLRARTGLAWLGGRGGGGYDSGKSDSKAMQRYNPAARSATADIHPGLGRIRSRSRDQVRNAPLATGAIAGTVTSVVGTGLDCQPSIDQDFLGLSDEDADAWELRAARIWRAWSETTECDIEGELRFPELQSLVFRSILESGDILRVRRFLWDDQRGQPQRGHTFATKIQLIEADRISNPQWGWDTAKVQGGVRFDHDGRTISYFVQTVHPGDIFLFRDSNRWDEVSAYSAKTGQRIAQLLFDKTRPGQRRGVPFLAPVIESLKQLDRYTEAELMAAVVAALFTVFVKSDTDADTSPLGGIEDASETPTAAGDLFLGEGLVVDLDPGEDIEVANPGRPNASFDPFFLAVTRQIGVALEIPHEVLLKHFQASYSASRGSLLEAYKFYRTRRRRLVTWICQPSYEDVISEAVARGALSAPGFFSDPFIRQAWLGTVWTGDAMPQIDPLKEANAAETRVQNGFSTIDRESREMNGTSFLENHRQRRKEQRMRAEDGLNRPAQPAAPVPPTDAADQADQAEALLAAGAGS